MMESKQDRKSGESSIARIREVFLASLWLGLTSFGGPVAHLGYSHAHYVKRKGWLAESTYLDLVTLCQILPGPASSQLGMAIGTLRAGLWGAVAAWVGFTLPSVILMAGFAWLLQRFHFAGAGWIHGLKLVALAVVFQAVVSMWKRMVTGKWLASVALASLVAMLVLGRTWTQVAVIVVAALVGSVWGSPPVLGEREPVRVGYGTRTANALLAGFCVLLVGSLVLGVFVEAPLAKLAEICYRAGALVYGGGHVVLPLLESSLVRGGLVDREVFLAGYGAAQVVPGPLFSFASYLGACVDGWVGACVATVAIFLPGSLLVLGAVPHWGRWREHPRILRSLSTINAAVVGILLAALYDPVWTTSVKSPRDLAVAAMLVLALVVWELPLPAVVGIGVVLSSALGMVPGA